MADSAVHMNREPMLMPSAPSASAATNPRASAKPTEAIIGMSILAAAAGISTRPGMSSSPGCPAHSNPVDADAVHTQALRLDGMAHRGALVQHLDPVVVEHR